MVGVGFWGYSRTTNCINVREEVIYFGPIFNPLGIRWCVCVHLLTVQDTHFGVLSP